jgi:hypothetical protein
MCRAAGDALTATTNVQQFESLQEEDFTYLLQVPSNHHSYAEDKEEDDAKTCKA